MNRLIILDSNALLHRAYHALPPLTSPSGEPTGAVYGFVSMLLRLKTDLAATYFAATFDRPAPTFRKELYKEYQSQRPPLDDALIKQITTVHEVLEAMNVPYFEQDGFEADDIIASLVKSIRTQQKNIIDQIIIVTGDRDILQLVENEKVLVYMPIKGLTEAKLYGEQEVYERLGVFPKQIPDWKALCGDPSDNYPGVDGIGPKTATDLITKFHDIETIYKEIEMDNGDIKERVKEKLLRDKENAFLSKNLATIRDTVEIAVTTESLHISTLNTEKTITMFQHLGFPSLIKRMNNKEVPIEIKKEKEKKAEKEENQLDLFS